MASLFRSIERSTPGSPPLAVRLVLSSERVKCMRRTGPARPGLATPFSASASSSRPGTTNRVRVMRTWHPAWTSSSSSSSSSPSSATRLSRYRTAVGVHSTEPNAVLRPDDGTHPRPCRSTGVWERPVFGWGVRPTPRRNFSWVL
ncbi:hypothetical protein L210DRAFT_3590520, partial [Boletus edulis BED1]